MSSSPGASAPSVVTARVCGTRSIAEVRAGHTPDGQADAVEGDRALFRDEARKRSRRLDRRVQRAAVLAAVAHARNAVDVAGDEVAAERVRGAQRRLEVDRGAGREPAERGARERLAGQLGLEAPVGQRDDREAHARDGDAVPALPAGGHEPAGVDREPPRAAAACADGNHAAHCLYDAGEHHAAPRRGRSRSSRSPPTSSRPTIANSSRSAIEAGGSRSASGRAPRPSSVGAR